MSFKLHPERGLTLTAMYRNQTYITRCLGNLIGLGMLQDFVAKQVGLEVGPLTCISTHAELDVGKNWRLTEARQLVRDAAALLRE
jgi:thymidylate synthase